MVEPVTYIYRCAYTAQLMFEVLAISTVEFACSYVYFCSAVGKSVIYSSGCSTLLEVSKWQVYIKQMKMALQRKTGADLKTDEVTCFV